MNNDFKTFARVKLHPVEVDGFGTVFVKTMNVGERLDFWNYCEANPDKWPRLIAIVKTVCDKDGNRMFNEDEYDFIKNEMDAEVTLTLGRHTALLNKLVPEAVEDAKKNSATTES